MKTIALLCVALLLAGCSRSKVAKTETEPFPAQARPLPGPLGLGGAIRDQLRTQNDAAKARRKQMDEIIENK